MDKAKCEEIYQWLIKADHDLRSARRLFSDDPPLLDTAAYHCQQSVEKALKAFLVLNDVQFSKIHLLSPLVEQCIDVDEGFVRFRETAEILTPFATVFRYPGDAVEPERSHVEEGLRLASMVIEYVVDRMPEKIRFIPLVQ